MTNDLRDKVVVVTGGARGIGFGVAQCFAEVGARVVIADMDLDSAQAAAQKLMTAGAPQALGLRCDVSRREQVQTMVDDAVKACGHIDILVNNAGICPFIDAMDISPETWQKTIDVNLTGAFHCTQLVAEKMIARGRGGRIVFITSLSEQVANAEQTDYAASKGGLKMAMVGFAISLAKHGITCNAVAPGIILTDMGREHWEKPENAAHIKQRVPLGRIGTPEDIGKAVRFFATDDAAYITGVSLRVDGGFLTRCV